MIEDGVEIDFDVGYYEWFFDCNLFGLVNVIIG